jgi:hypothetical protein
VTGRSDIDVLDDADWLGGPIRKATGYEAACLFVFGLAALLAALFLVGQAVARYASSGAADLQVLKAVGLTRRQAVPVLPAIAGAVAGVLGVLAVFTFSAGVSDAIANPARFGITWQLDAFYGADGQDFGPAAQVERATAASPLVAGYLDLRVGAAQAKGLSIESFTYAPIDGKRVRVVLTAGGMPHSADQITLAPTTTRELDVGVGSALRLTGGPQTRIMTVSGIGFVPAGPHNNYDQGAWLTPTGFDRLFHGAHYAFKFHFAVVALKPGVATGTAARRLTATAAAINGGEAFPFTPTPGGPVQQLKDLAVLPTALGGFLALLAAGAVGYALTTTVRRRSHELAVLRALGMTSRQARLVIVTQATVLAVAGLAAGIPLGFVAGRTVWRVVANFTPLAYQPPFSPWALALIAPAALLAANALALWPGSRAARLRPAHVLRTE